MTKSNIGAPVKQLSCIGGCQGDLRMLQCENKVKGCSTPRILLFSRLVTFCEFFSYSC